MKHKEGVYPQNIKMRRMRCQRALQSTRTRLEHLTSSGPFPVKRQSRCSGRHAPPMKLVACSGCRTEAQVHLNHGVVAPQVCAALSATYQLLISLQLKTEAKRREQELADLGRQDTSLSAQIAESKMGKEDSVCAQQRPSSSAARWSTRREGLDSKHPALLCHPA